MNAQVNTETMSLDFILEHADEIAKIKAGSQQLRESVAGELEKIAQHKEKLVTAENAAGTRDAEKSGLWRDVATIAANVAAWAKENGLEQWAGQIFADTVKPVMPVKPTGEKLAKPAATVASYLSTGRAVVTDYLIGDGLPAREDGSRPAVTEVSYADIRGLYRKPGNPAIDAAVKNIRQWVGEFAKYGQNPKIRKHLGKDAPNVVEALEKLAESVKAMRDPIMAAREATAKSSEASKEIEANRQQRPTEAGTVETVSKPEAGRAAA